MKRLVIIVLLMLMAVPMAEAKRRETPEEIERKTRHYSGWEWGAAGRVSLVFYELDHMRIAGQPAVRAYQSQAKMGGNIMVNGGYFLSNHWKLGLELGAQIQYNCLFNFVNAGTNILFDKGLRFGTTAAGGIGFRFQSPDSNHKIDLMLGYQALMLSPRPVIKEPFGYKPQDVKRIGFNQSVFLGIGISF